MIRGAVLAASLAVVGAGGCGFFATAYERNYGAAVPGEYKGLANKAVLIVVDTPMALQNEYTQAAREITEFVKDALRPINCRFVETQQVLAWQQQTPGWNRMTDRDLATRFGVDRVLHIELVEYATKDAGVEGYVRGRINTSVRVYEAERDGIAPAWGPRRIGALWPEDGPADMMRTSETLARRNVLVGYAQELAKCFMDHRDLRPMMTERRL